MRSMRPVLLALLMLFAGLAGCLSDSETSTPVTEETVESTSTTESTTPEDEADRVDTNEQEDEMENEAIPTPSPLRVATFNLANFGPSKSSKDEKVATYVEVINDYDLVAVQEITDKSEQAPDILLKALKAEDRAWDLVLSRRTGADPTDRNYQEQYGFFYRSNVVLPIEEGKLFLDPNDAFVREPQATPFKTVQEDLTFILMTIHTSPTFALPEVQALAEAHLWATSEWPWEDDIIIVGDFNAACNYVQPGDLAGADIASSSFTWVVPDNADTNVATSSACAYDRVVLDTEAASHFNGTWGIDQRESIGNISDHFLVWFDLERTDDTDIPTVIKAARPYSGWTGPTTGMDPFPVIVMLAAAAMMLLLQPEISMKELQIEKDGEVE